MKIQNSTYRKGGWYLATLAFTMMTVATVRADYQSTVLNDHPLAYYPLNLAVDTNTDNSGYYLATDVSGNGNDGTYINIYPGYNNVPGPSAYITNGVAFDGLTTYVDLSTGSNTALLNFGGPITMEAWVQPANTTEGPADILAKGYDSATNDDELALRANGGNYYGGTYNNVNGGGNASGGQQTTNWAYVVSTYDGTNWNLYVNGVLVGQGADAVGALDFPDPWAIGNGTANGNGRLFEGNITQVALYNYGLTPSQVLTHYFVGEYGITNASNAVPIITTQPQPQATYLGGSATFTVAVLSVLPTTNQWYKGSTPLVGQTNATLTLYNVQAGDVGDYSVVVGNRNGATNSTSASLTLLTPGNSLKWSPNANSGVWDTDNSANWINLANSQQTVFNTNDQVLFDDTTGVPTNVTVSGTVLPSIITVNSDTNNFLFSGSGTISGPGSLIKEGRSTLTLNSGFSLAGPVKVDAGTVVSGNYAFNSVASVTITNGATVDFGGSTLTGNKLYTVSGSGVNGQGALVNSINYYPLESLDIVMAGNTTFGGIDRWDLASGSKISGPYHLTIDWSADTNNPYGEWNQVTIGADVAGITLTNGSKLGAKQMDAGFQDPNTVFTVSTNCQLIFWNGGWNGTIHLLGGSQAFQFGAPGAFNGYKVIMENGAVWNTYGGSGAQSINVPIALNGMARFVIGDQDRTYTNVISGTGGIVADIYNHAMILSASNTYSGPTIIGSDGNTPQVNLSGSGSISHSSLIFFNGNDPTVTHMDVTGRSDQTLTLASGQTLSGVGGVNGSIVVSAGATLSPSGTTSALGVTWGGTNAVGAIAASDNVTLNGTTIIKLAGSGSNDVVQAGANIAYGGTLDLVNISGSPMADGDSFQVFSAAGYSGSFASITPATPGAGLAWDTSQLSSGIVSVVAAPSQPVIGSATLSGGNLILAGTGGTTNGTFYVLTSTNLATPLANWTPLSTNTFDGSGNFSVTNAINPANPHQFYLLKQP